MPSVTHDGQSFAIDGRRLWLVGAALEYARIPDALWPQRIAAVKQAGFNTVAVSCPWMQHEPRRDRFSFDGANDVRRFVELCGSAGLRVVLRPGPAVGNGFDGGGLPGWLLDIPDLRLREANGPFLERVSLYFRKLFAELADLYAGSGGPIILVQSEHAWLGSNPEQAEKYLREITRMIRESGVNVPVINANDLWQESTGTIDTWRGWDDLLANLRQLRRVQPSAPRIVSSFDVAPPATWGSELPPRRSPATVLQHMAQVLAAGAQPIVSPFHGGTNFGFLGGRDSGTPDAFFTTAAAAHAPLGEAGARGETYLALKRLATFANHFGHVFAEL
jgi:beta-galactosidase